MKLGEYTKIFFEKVFVKYVKEVIETGLIVGKLKGST